MKEILSVSIFWFRRDLRLEDNAGLYNALRSTEPVLSIFIFDTDILDKLSDRKDKRVEFIHDALLKLNKSLSSYGSSLHVYHGKPVEIFKNLISGYSIKSVFTNHDYEPYAIKRDKEVNELLNANGISFKTYKDQVIFEKNEVQKDDGLPYTVFTPYSRKWKNILNDFYIKPYPSEKYLTHLFKSEQSIIPSLSEIGFQPTNTLFPESKFLELKIKQYKETRDYPSQNGTSRLGVHLRFGTLSIRNMVCKAMQTSETWLNELIWREFYMMILYKFPHVKDGAFKKQYDNIPWRNNENEFKAWCEGMTGYPLVDAGMRELNGTGFMHNRVRMVVASFLCKHLLIDWRWGEAYFSEKLLDYDMAANNGGWQWAAGTGCDASPYFRIFNPYEQAKKFDDHQEYISKWLPEIKNGSYPLPIVEHKYARERAIQTYKMALLKAG